MKAQYIELDRLSIVAIPGMSGSGKTSTARFLVAQLLLDNTETIICDPHGHIENESLGHSIEPLEKYLYRSIARDHDEIIRIFREIRTEFDTRIRTGTKEPRIAVFLDETPDFFSRCGAHEMKEIGDLFVSLVNQARKVNIRVFLLGQNWKKDYIGARSIRSSINTVLFHTLSEDETKLFIPSAPAELRRKIRDLDQGQIFLYGMGIKATTIRVPAISLDDLKNLRITKRDTRDHKRINAESRDYTQNHERSHNTQNTVKERSQKCVIRIEKAKSLEHAVQMIDFAIEKGMNKGDTLEVIFDTTRGGRNKKWLAASKLYDRRYNEHTSHNGDMI